MSPEVKAISNKASQLIKGEGAEVMLIYQMRLGLRFYSDKHTNWACSISELNGACSKQVALSCTV